jgi:rod shape determining protein RodA
MIFEKGLKAERKIWANIDWLLLLLYGGLVSFGWLNLYAVGYEGVFSLYGLFDFTKSTGKQFMWISSSIVLLMISSLFDTQFYRSIAYFFYGFVMLLLVGTLLWGVQVGGHSSWFQWGKAQLQPTEFAKLACALACAKYLDRPTVKLTQFKTQLSLLCMILLPVGLILLQGDMGSSLVFVAFIFVFYREGFPFQLILIGLAVITIFILTLLLPSTHLIVGTLGIGLLIMGIGRWTTKQIIALAILTLITISLIEGFHWVMEKALKPHQQNRLKVLVDPQADPLGIGWNVTQSKIAIGSGGAWGKGFLKGTQTKYGFVPEQRTDFIFCTIGEEHGWIGASLFITAFVALLLRTIYIAERQRLRFARVYGYGVAGVLFFHFLVNVGMTIGLLPVIGIPLPFVSYGGSSLWSFSMMLFILLSFDADRRYYLSWKGHPSI